MLELTNYETDYNYETDQIYSIESSYLDNL